MINYPYTVDNPLDIQLLSKVGYEKFREYHATISEWLTGRQWIYENFQYHFNKEEDAVEFALRF